MKPARVLTGALAAIALIGTAACSGGSPSAAPATSAPAQALSRWWSNSAVTAGSTVDPAHPYAADAQLHTSTSDYCGMLQQTLSAGRSILPGGSQNLPLATLEAFVGELRQVAPADVAGQWRVLGDAILTFARTNGASLGTGSNPSAVASAAADISANARTACNLNLSASAAPVASVKPVAPVKPAAPIKPVKPSK